MPNYTTLQDLLAMCDPEYKEDWMPEPAEARYGPRTSSHCTTSRAIIKMCSRAYSVDTQSLEFLPQLNVSVVAAALALVPSELKSRKNDTIDKLIFRISSSHFFDLLEALLAGGSKGKKRVRVNDTDYSQPRRKSWSVVVVDVHQNEHGEWVRTMYAYGKPNSRIRTERDATPMPREIAELGVQCFLAVRHVLADVCKSSPPNHCQLLGYYGLFNSKVGRHKDDHTIQDWHDLLEGKKSIEEAVNSSKGSMLAGSDVLIYSVGPLPVRFAWAFAPANDPFAKREMHEVHPYMCIDLRHGSLFVFKAIDDVRFFHEVCIDWEHSGAHECDYRFAFVFRWLGEEQQCDFPV